MNREDRLQLNGGVIHPDAKRSHRLRSIAMPAIINWVNAKIRYPHFRIEFATSDRDTLKVATQTDQVFFHEDRVSRYMFRCGKPRDRDKAKTAAKHPGEYGAIPAYSHREKEYT